MNESTERTIRVKAAAKINLYLHVVGRRADGYHELDSLIAFTNVYDTLTLEPSDNLSLEIKGTFAPRLPNSEENLVLRAARALGEAAGIDPLVNITLQKELPIAAGLGSGSADAAAALQGLAKLWKVDVGPMELREVGFSLGADIPACLFNDTVQVSGVGEHLQQGPNLPDAGLLLVNPGITLATSSVFKARRGGFSQAMPLMKPLTSLATFVHELEDRSNDLTEPALRLAPVIREVLAMLANAPKCRLARLSGSGATCFGLFDDLAAAEEAAASIDIDSWWVRPTCFRTSQN